MLRLRVTNAKRWMISGRLSQYLDTGKRHLSGSVAGSPEPAITALAAELPHLLVSTNTYDLETHGRGESFHPPALPSAVVTPRSREDVVDVVKYCSTNRIPIIPYGAGTSVEGHVNAIHGGVSLDMSQLSEIESFESENGVPDAMARVGAGVTRKRLNEELR